jgi:hypothetical protein
MRTVLVRYKTKEDQAEANATLVRAVFDELAACSPGGFHYVTFRLADGVTFVHLATMQGETPLPSLAAFQRFQEDIRARCESPPVLSEASVVGSYGLPAFVAGGAAVKREASAPG